MFADISENLPKSLKCSDFVYKIKLLLKFPGGAKALLEINYKYIGLTYVLRVRGGHLCQKTDAVKNQ